MPGLRPAAVSARWDVRGVNNVTTCSCSLMVFLQRQPLWLGTYVGSHTASSCQVAGVIRGPARRCMARMLPMVLWLSMPFPRSATTALVTGLKHRSVEVTHADLRCGCGSLLRLVFDGHRLQSPLPQTAMNIYIVRRFAPARPARKFAPVYDE